MQLYRDERDSIWLYSGKGADRTTNEGKASGRSNRHCHLPSGPGVLPKVRACMSRYFRNHRHVDTHTPPVARRNIPA